MKLYRNSSQANLDVKDIALYIHDLNPPAADHFLDELDETCRELARHPGMGRMRPELGEGVRSFPVGNYLVFYVAIHEGIEVVRVIYGGRDLPRVFKKL